MTGKSLNHYSIVEKIGAGGMGEVFRATDSKLRREVAIKLLPQEFTQDHDRLMRFQREAQLLAQLHHPNIASVFGLEEEGGVRGLVMELVEGPTLDERLHSGPLSLEEALPIALQIAQALEVAHGKGIIHRDLKPQNIKASTDGKVKVLDFGLAKAMDPVEDGTIAGADLADSPTISPSATVKGVILGTASYMSPEQARGAQVDKRSDIWAFGVVLYEMLAGGELFEGDTVSDRIAGVLKSQIELSRLPHSTPAELKRLLRRCLQRDPQKRLHDIADARIVLEELLSGQVEEAAIPTAAPRGMRWLMIAPWVLVLVLVGLQLARSASNSSTPADTSPRALEISVPRGNLLSEEATPVLSPDGSMIVFGAADPYTGVQLWLRQLDGFESLPLPGTQGASHPFWSPDSGSIGFFHADDGTLCRYDLSTSLVRVLLTTGQYGRGGSWREDGTILFSRSANSPIERMSADGGPAEAVTVLDPEILDGSHRYPVSLPDGDHFLFTMWSNHLDTANRVGGVYLASLAGGVIRRVAPDVSQAVLVGSDKLLLRRDESLVALDFDLDRIEIVGNGEPIVENPLFGLHSGALAASASNAGEIVFALEAGEGSGQLVWLDRDGQSLGNIGSDRLTIRQVAPAPNGRLFAVEAKTSAGSNILVGDERRQVMTRLTPNGVDALHPTWSPGSDRVAYSKDHSGRESVFIRVADGSQPSELVCYDEGRDFRPTDWTADGLHLILESREPTSSRNSIWILDLQTGEAREILSDPTASIGSGNLSDDGRWIAYSSDESGNPEVFVRPYPDLAGKWKLSQGGGDDPHWSADGRELYFMGISDHSLNVVSIQAEGDRLEAGIPETLFTPKSPLLAVHPSPDHTRFLAGVVPGDVRSEPIRMILDWRSSRESR